MRDIEASRPEELVIQNKSVISGMPEQIGLTQNDVTAGLLCSQTPDEARTFVQSYFDHVVTNIDLEHTNDARALAKRHLIDQLYYTHLPVEINSNHPANARSRISRRLAVEAIMDILENPDDLYFYEQSDWPADRDFGKIREQILARRRASKRLA